MTQANSSFTTPFALDALDRDIIGLLKIDGRISFTEVSKRVCFGTHDEMLAFYAKLHKIPGVIRYESQVVMKLLKAEYKYVLS